jgi:hypothetical protein
VVLPWPPLAWVVELTRGSATIPVHLGECVEAKDAWFCEAAWAGDFQDGDFDTTDVVAGSGARIRGDTVVFVASGSNLDRLHVFRRSASTLLVSNSLCALLAWVDGRADLDRLDYTSHFASYRYAFFGDYSRVFPSTAGPVEVTYFRNLAWDGGELTEIEKPHTSQGFASFAEYRAFMRRSMERLARNATSAERSRPFRLLCPISKGYDSPAVAVMAAEVAALETFTFARDRDGRDDSGAAIAATLGVPCHVVDRHAWKSASLPEVPFLAGSGSVGDLGFKSAESLLPGTLLLSGVNSILWKRDTIPTRDTEMGDGALLGLSEYRLWTGFLCCSVPSWGIRHIGDIVQISTSVEMQPWDVGGSYNKPIPRRILEEAGIARGRFATGKSGVSALPHSRSDYLTASSRRDLLDWLAEQRRRGSRSLPSPRLAAVLDAVLAPVSRVVFRLMLFCRDTGLSRYRVVQFVLRHLRRPLARPYYHHAYLVHWAVDRATRRYGPGEPASRV